MLKVKCVYYIKLSIITILAIALLELVESAPQFPVFFLLSAIVILCSIHMLWISVLKDEQKIKKRTHVRFSHKDQKEHHHEKAA